MKIKFLQWNGFVSMNVWLNKTLTSVKETIWTIMCVPCPRFSQALGSIEKEVWKIRSLEPLDRRRSSDSPRSPSSRPHLFHLGLKYIYEHLAFLNSIDCKEHVHSVRSCNQEYSFFFHKCRSADYSLETWEETDCVLYEDVGTIYTVLPATPGYETYTEKAEWTELVQVPPTERLRICNIPILWWFCTPIRTTSPHTKVSLCTNIWVLNF